MLPRAWCWRACACAGSFSTFGASTLLFYRLRSLTFVMAFDVVSGLRGGEQALDVVSKMLAYDPLKRIKPLEVCSHEFVDEVCMTSARFIFCRF